MYPADSFAGFTGHEPRQLTDKCLIILKNAAEVYQELIIIASFPVALGEGVIVKIVKRKRNKWSTRRVIS